MQTAQIVLRNGTIVIPVDTPYDRQQLIEDLLRSVRSARRIHVSLDHATWTLEPAPTPHPVCKGCGAPTTRGVCRCKDLGMANVFCVECAFVRPLLSAHMLRQLPAKTVLHDVQVQAAFGTEWIPWMRWPRATPAEILDDMRLQRRFVPVVRFRCSEITVLPTPLQSSEASTRRRYAGIARRA